MRAAVLALSALIALPAAAQAQAIGPVADISVTVKVDDRREREVIGDREVAILTERLRAAVIKEVGALSSSGGRLELIVNDAKPNRPTMTELAAKPGLSMIDSFGIGGAEITGVYVAPDGVRTPVAYRWYGDDIRNARFYSEWHDAERAFRQFAERLAG